MGDKLRSALLAWLIAGGLAALPQGLGAAPRPAKPAADCADGLKVELDRDSLARREEGPPFTDEAIDRFAGEAGAAFKTAARELCANGALQQVTFVPFRRLLVRSGSGAVDTLIYEDAETLGPDTLIFEWVFSEEKLGLPAPADIAAGLRCWSHWDDERCNERLP
jgi:hypothetical protein